MAGTEVVSVNVTGVQFVQFLALAVTMAVALSVTLLRLAIAIRRSRSTELGARLRLLLSEDWLTATEGKLPALIWALSPVASRAPPILPSRFDRLSQRVR